MNLIKKSMALLLLLSFLSFAYESFNGKTKTLLPDDFDTSQQEEELRKAIDQEILFQEAFHKKMSQECKEESEKALASAPIFAQHIVNHLQDANFYKERTYRYSMFVGASATERTKAAQAIAYKMVRENGWLYFHLDARLLLSNIRNEALVVLREILKTIAELSKTQPIIVVIDELHVLLENTDDPRDDTRVTSSYLCSFLDRQSYNENFFLIGTMSRTTHLSQQLKSRILSRIIDFNITSKAKD